MYVAGKLVNGVLNVHLGPVGKDGEYDIMPFMKEGSEEPDRAAAQEYCPWTLFPLDN